MEWETVELFVTDAISTLTGLPINTVWRTVQAFASDDEESSDGRTYSCGLCREENDHYKTTCPERFCENCDCDDADCTKYDYGAACDCCI